MDHLQWLAQFHVVRALNVLEDRFPDLGPQEGRTVEGSLYGEVIIDVLEVVDSVEEQEERLLKVKWIRNTCLQFAYTELSVELSIGREVVHQRGDDSQTNAVHHPKNLDKYLVQESRCDINNRCEADNVSVVPGHRRDHEAEKSLGRLLALVTI